MKLAGLQVGDDGLISCCLVMHDECRCRVFLWPNTHAHRHAYIHIHIHIHTRTKIHAHARIYAQRKTPHSITHISQNMLVAFSMGAPGYTQVKFNVLNYHIIHNTKDRKPGIITGAICCICFFFTLSGTIMSVLPRSVGCSIRQYAG